MSTETERNKAVVGSFLSALGEGRISDLPALLSDDATWWLGGTHRYSGRHPVAYVMDTMGTLFADAAEPMQGQLGSITAEGERIVVESSGRVVFKDGRVYENYTCIVFTLHEGRITALREYGDTDLIVRLFG